MASKTALTASWSAHPGTVRNGRVAWDRVLVTREYDPIAEGPELVEEFRGANKGRWAYRLEQAFHLISIEHAR